MSRSREFRDAIVMSGWGWETFNVPERVALALASLGSKVLYCQNPVSLLRGKRRGLEEIKSGIHRLVPEFFGHRLNRIPLGFSQLQARVVANQILQNASKLDLEDPLFIYAHGDFYAPLCRAFKRKGFPLIHGCFDYPEPGQDRHIELSDLTLTLSKTVFHQLKAKYGEKIALIPEVRWISDPNKQTLASGSRRIRRDTKTAARLHWASYRPPELTSSRILAYLLGPIGSFCILARRSVFLFLTCM